MTCTPGTLQNCSDKTNDPYGYPEQLAMYVTKWVAGAKNTYGLDIDYIGSWNERAYNIPYLKQLRASLDAANFSNTKIIAPDSGWDIARDILADPGLASAVHGIGAHYPGMHSSSDAVATGKPLWASEDDSVSFCASSAPATPPPPPRHRPAPPPTPHAPPAPLQTYDNDVGAECWARIINRNYVLGASAHAGGRIARARTHTLTHTRPPHAPLNEGNMTSTINWQVAFSAAPLPPACKPPHAPAPLPLPFPPFSGTWSPPT